MEGAHQWKSEGACRADAEKYRGKGYELEVKTQCLPRMPEQGRAEQADDQDTPGRDPAGHRPGEQQTTACSGLCQKGLPEDVGHLASQRRSHDGFSEPKDIPRQTRTLCGLGFDLSQVP